MKLPDNYAYDPSAPVQSSSEQQNVNWLIFIDSVLVVGGGECLTIVELPHKLRIWVRMWSFSLINILELAYLVQIET